MLLVSHVILTTNTLVCTAQLADSLMPTEIRPGVAVAMVTGTLVTKDNQYELKVRIICH